VARRKTVNKRRSSIRERRESDVIPPWPDVNADITCEHGNLKPSKGPTGFAPR
jgi:hypothetical protein